MSASKNDAGQWSATLAQGRAVEFGYSRGKSLLLAVVCVVVMLIGLVMISADGVLVTLLGVIAVLFGLLGLIVQIRRLCSRTPAVGITAEGIAMTTAKAGVVPWGAIIDVYPVTQERNVFVEIVVTPQEAARQADAGLTVAERETEDGDRKAILWMPNGLAVSSPALCEWLVAELGARRPPGK